MRFGNAYPPITGRPLPPERHRDLCWAAMYPLVFPDWHRADPASYRGTIQDPALGYVAPYGRESLIEVELYGRHGVTQRSPLLARGQWALRVRVYRPRPRPAGE